MADVEVDIESFLEDLPESLQELLGLRVFVRQELHLLNLRDRLLGVVVILVVGVVKECGVLE